LAFTPTLQARSIQIANQKNIEPTTGQRTIIQDVKEKNYVRGEHA